MISLAYARNEERLSEKEYERLCRSLPPEMRDDLRRYRRWQDRQAGLLGKLLMNYTVREVMGEPPDQSTLVTDAYRRPFLAGRPDLDFNISHTAGLVVCAAAAGMGRLGVDVERVGEIQLAEFRRVFTEEEYALLSGLPDATATFFRLWTRKEAVMKADGRGFSLDPAGIDCLPDRIGVDGNCYAVRELDLGAGYAAHLAASDVDEVVVGEVRFPRHPRPRPE
ncbi:4'-phosphopantetheinyl transferase [Lewinella marina]|uniref:4'-phosphopantetheinyl transferase n=1 Tax=Neolewinella marina TaxID=438751 RepID=A0A2G0CDI6_9BACT|nr:4'-phosphopantetheinyl transferase superfamily protein [Neolewinella marina]NJB85993.1 4'-phosphopantetheinyl transferase [Neolewinella marina]PHK98039.1 hypothetical protein CGL56_12675 [Neolewinella marina]